MVFSPSWAHDVSSACLCWILSVEMREMCWSYVVVVGRGRR